MNIIAFSVIARIQNSIPQLKVTSFTIYIHIYNCKFLLQHPKDQSVDQRNYLPGQYLDIALIPRKYRYCPGCRVIQEILPCTGLWSAHAKWYIMIVNITIFYNSKSNVMTINIIVSTIVWQRYHVVQILVGKTLANLVKWTSFTNILPSQIHISQCQLLYISWIFFAKTLKWSISQSFIPS